MAPLSPNDPNYGKGYWQDPVINTSVNVSVNSGGGGILLETNGVPNTKQNILNLVSASDDLSITSDGEGNVSFAVEGSGSGSFVPGFPPLSIQGSSADGTALVGIPNSSFDPDTGDVTLGAGFLVNSNGSFVNFGADGEIEIFSDENAGSHGIQISTIDGGGTGPLNLTSAGGIVQTDTSSNGLLIYEVGTGGITLLDEGGGGVIIEENGLADLTTVRLPSGGGVGISDQSVVGITLDSTGAIFSGTGTGPINLTSAGAIILTDSSSMLGVLLREDGTGGVNIFDTGGGGVNIHTDDYSGTGPINLTSAGGQNFNDNSNSGIQFLQSGLGGIGFNDTSSIGIGFNEFGDGTFFVGSQGNGGFIFDATGNGAGTGIGTGALQAFSAGGVQINDTSGYGILITENGDGAGDGNIALVIGTGGEQIRLSNESDYGIEIDATGTVGGDGAGTGPINLTSAGGINLNDNSSGDINIYEANPTSPINILSSGGGVVVYDSGVNGVGILSIGANGGTGPINLISAGSISILDSLSTVGNSSSIWIEEWGTGGLSLYDIGGGGVYLDSIGNGSIVLDGTGASRGNNDLSLGDIELYSKSGISLTTTSVSGGPRILAVDQGSQTFSILGNLAYVPTMQVGKTFAVSYSTGNDGTYTVNTLTFVNGYTQITVAESIPDPTVDGLIAPITQPAVLVNSVGGVSITDNSLPGLVFTESNSANGMSFFSAGAFNIISAGPGSQWSDSSAGGIGIAATQPGASIDFVAPISVFDLDGTASGVITASTIFNAVGGYQANGTPGISGSGATMTNVTVVNGIITAATFT